MADDTTNLLRQHYFNPAPWHALPPVQLQQAMAPQGQLPGAQGLFEGMHPAQVFWLQHLLGQGYGLPGPPGPIDPYTAMMYSGVSPGGIYGGEGGQGS